jgi:hypothetical protein
VSGVSPAAGQNSSQSNRKRNFDILRFAFPWFCDSLFYPGIESVALTPET